MEIRQLKTFCTVAAELSFTRAAETLAYAQSSITAQIQDLERQLGVPLFDRLGKRVALTEAGGRLLFYAERILQLADEAKYAVPGNEEPSGTLRIGGPESLFTYRLPRALREFRARCPKVELQFQTGPFCSDLRRLVLQGTVDAALVLDQRIQSDVLNVEPLVVERLVVITEPGHRLAAREQVQLSELEGEVLLTTELGCSYRTLFEKTLRGADAEPAAKLEFVSVEAIKQNVMAGIGIAALPEMTVRAELESRRLAALRFADCDLSVVTQLLWHKEKWVSPALRIFLETVKRMAAGGAGPVTG
ncbi:LysR family transcriptional regulator [Paenibacillus humicola]|uniref:LysR family transcriptional regulator n=1 Tax=Paenibacillus humicola TaxID=3110540 RepID=UPI00237B304A|nr:LysR family transcriptional regulator [Paenibacillus humicola]